MMQVQPLSECPTYNGSEGERAMLIKDSCGDWAIVTGKWCDFQVGRPEMTGVCKRISHFVLPSVHVRCLQDIFMAIY